MTWAISTVLVDGLPAGATLLPTPEGTYSTLEYTFRLQFDGMTDISVATDELDAGSTQEVQVNITCSVRPLVVHLEGGKY